MDHLLDLNTVTVGQVMTPVTKTVLPCDRLSDVAKLFSEHHIGSAPVVDAGGACIGIITRSDLVNFQAELPDVNQRVDHGTSFEISQSDPEGSLELVPHPFDEVERHMTRYIQTTRISDSLYQASRVMCLQQIHHLVVLGDNGKPEGILSSLDILSCLVSHPEN